MPPSPASVATSTAYTSPCLHHSLLRTSPDLSLRLPHHRLHQPADPARPSPDSAAFCCVRVIAGALNHCRFYSSRQFNVPLPPARACTAVPYSHCPCRALIEPQLHTVSCPGLLPMSPRSALHCPVFIFISGALLQRLFRLQLWCVPEVGPAFGLGSDLVPQSERSRLQSQLQFQPQTPRPSLRSIRGSGGARGGWDPGPRHQCLSGDPGGPGPPSGPVHPARVSHPHPDLSRHLLHQQQRRPLRLSCRLPPGFGGRYSLGTPSRGMYGSTAENCIRSRTMMSRR